MRVVVGKGVRVPGRAGVGGVQNGRQQPPFNLQLGKRVVGESADSSRGSALKIKRWADGGHFVSTLQECTGELEGGSPPFLAQY